MRPRSSIAAVPLIALALAGPAAAQRRPALTSVRVQPGLAAAEQQVTAARLLEHMRVLASDRFAGRGPGTRGEDSTVAYLSGQFRRMGLQPGNAGSYVQEVPLVGTTSRVAASVTLGGETRELRSPDEIVAWSSRPDTLVRVDASEVVFVGYGVSAPEFGWDDYKGVDLRGKTVVMLVGDPPVPDPRDPARLDPRVFRGDAMTYYGRWTYKYEMAAARGAAACIIVHQTGPAGYAWGVVASNTGRERTEIAGAGERHIPVEGWVQLEVARRLFQAAGQDFDALQRAAGTRAFRPVALGGATASFTVRNAVRQVRSRNVVARIDGSDPALRGQYLLYTAHWDHFGVGRAIGGDSIYNGALDNAGGLAWMLETARAFRALPTAPRRTVVFLAVTAEEQGLLGARWYAAHPIYPLARTLADINMDIPNPWGRTRSIVSVSHGQTTLETILASEAARQQRTVRPDPEPEKGYFYRSDHFELARNGVPALSFLFPGADYVGQPADYGQRVRAGYVANDYHKPTDEVKPDWDLAGMVDDTRLLFRVGVDVANGERWPEWNPGTEFRARREQMLGRSTPPMPCGGTRPGCVRPTPPPRP